MASILKSTTTALEDHVQDAKNEVAAAKAAYTAADEADADNTIELFQTYQTMKGKLKAAVGVAAAAVSDATPEGETKKEVVVADEVVAPVETMQMLEGHEEGVTSVDYSSDGRFVGGGGGGGGGGRFDNIKKLGEVWKKKKNDLYKKYNVKQTGDVHLDEFNLSKARSPDLEWSRGSPRTFVTITTFNHCACGSNKEDKKCCGPKKR